MIKISRISKYYVNGKIKTHVLKDISLEIQSGEFVTLTGPSGCGKSTVLNIIGGMDRQTDGTYYFGGNDIGRLGAKELARFRNKNIGFVFQAFHLARELNVIDNVSLPLGYAGVERKERKKRAMELLDRLRLADKYRSYPAELSGGEMQRVAIARALANRPQVLLADEPTGNLDQKNGQMIMNILHELNQERLTILMVTHDSAISRQSARNICMEDGCLPD